MIGIIAVVVFFFVLYGLSRDDFVLMRRNVSLNTVFDSAFVVIFVGLFFSRLVYVLTHFSSAFLNPLVFFIIPYFPGLSASGFLLGSLLTLYFVVKRQKLPLGKLYDVFAMSLTPAVATFFAGEAVVSLVQKNYLFLSINMGYALFLLIGFFVLQMITVKASWKDGSLTFPALSLSLVVLVFSQFVLAHFKSLPVELSYFIAIFFLLFAGFLVKTLRRAGE